MVSLNNLFLLILLLLKYLSPNVLYENFSDWVISPLEKCIRLHYFPNVNIKCGFIYIYIYIFEKSIHMICIRLAWWLSGKEFTYQCRRHGFDPRSGKSPPAINKWACALGPIGCSSGAHKPQPLEPRDPGACAPQQGVPLQGRPCTATKK